MSQLLEKRKTRNRYVKLKFKTTIIKLESKHILNYLNHGLKGEFLGKKDIVTEYDFVHNIISSMNNGSVELKDFVPYLRPLSDLTMNGYDGKPLLFPSHQLIKHIEHGQDIFNCDYNEINYLIRNHFDVFNLIPNNLAIDINAIDK